MSYSGHLKFSYDENKGIIMDFKGSGNFSLIFSFQIPSVWKEMTSVGINYKKTPGANIKIEMDKLNENENS